MIYLVNETLAISFWLLPLLALAAVWIWTIVDIVRSEFQNANDKLLYLIAALLFPFVGTIIYFLVDRHKRLQRHF